VSRSIAAVVNQTVAWLDVTSAIRSRKSRG